MTDLSKKIRQLLHKQSISASSLEKKAGIGPSSLQNILQGRVKNPSLEIVKAIANALGYTVSELLEETSDSPQLAKIFKEQEWKQELYLNVLESVINVYRCHNIKTLKIDILETIESIYDYCLKYNKIQPDKDFVEWFILQKYQ